MREYIILYALLGLNSKIFNYQLGDEVFVDKDSVIGNVGAFTQYIKIGKFLKENGIDPLNYSSSK